MGGMDTPSPTTVVDLTALRLIDVPTLCAAWNVEKDWVYDMVEKGVENGGLPYVKLGPRTLRFSVPALEEWMANRTQRREAA